METRPWKIELPSRNLEIELTTVSSNHHVELNPSDAGNNDRYVVQEVIKVRTHADAPSHAPQTHMLTHGQTVKQSTRIFSDRGSSPCVTTFVLSPLLVLC